MNSSYFVSLQKRKQKVTFKGRKEWNETWKAE